MNKSIHIAVIGAGTFGGWTALQLLRRGCKVTLLDAWGPGNSRSSSGGETRIIRCVYGVDAIYSRWTRNAFEDWEKLQQDSGITIYEQIGQLWLFASDDTYAKDAKPILNDLNLPFEQLDPADAKIRFNQFDHSGIQSVWLETRAGFLRARQSCMALRDRFVKEGGEYIQSSALPGKIENHQLTSIRTDIGREISADAFIFACGPWLAQLFPELLTNKIRPSRQELHYFGSPANTNLFSPKHMPAWVFMDDCVYYGLPDIDGRGVKVAEDTRREDFDPTSGDRSSTPAAIQQARNFIKKRMPVLVDAPLVETRVCQYANTCDGNLVIDRLPGVENAWIAGGGSGHGFKLGPSVGNHLADCIVNGASPDPMFSISRLIEVEMGTSQFQHY